MGGLEDSQRAQTWLSTLRDALGQALLFSSKPPQVYRDECATEAPSASLRGSLWSQRRWQGAFETVFYEGPPLAMKAVLKDDLLIFVWMDDDREEECCATAGDTPFFPLRRDRELPTYLKEDESEAKLIDWRGSFLLNLVLHTRFRLIECLCAAAEVEKVLDRARMESCVEGVQEVSERFSEQNSCCWDSVGNSIESQLSPDRKKSFVAHADVHPSPTRLTIAKNGSKLVKGDVTRPSYPNIYFAVDDVAEERAWKEIHRDESSECYCLLLQADILSRWGEAFKICEELIDNAGHEDRAQEDPTSPSSNAPNDVPRRFEAISENENTGVNDASCEKSVDIQSSKSSQGSDLSSVFGTPVAVFSGCVRTEQLSEALGSRTSKISRVTGSSNPILVRMQGPTGTGRAEVAVRYASNSQFLDRAFRRENVLRLWSSARNLLRAATESIGNLSVENKAKDNISDVNDDSGSTPLDCSIMFVLVCLSVPIDELVPLIAKAIYHSI